MPANRTQIEPIYIAIRSVRDARIRRMSSAERARLIISLRDLIARVEAV
jgi:hypothetical protein